MLLDKVLHLSGAIDVAPADREDGTKGIAENCLALSRVVALSVIVTNQYQDVSMGPDLYVGAKIETSDVDALFKHRVVSPHKRPIRCA